MRGAKELTRAIKRSTIASRKQENAEYACFLADETVLAIAKQWQPPANDFTPAKHAVLEQIKKGTANYYQAWDVMQARLEQERITGIKDHTVHYACDTISHCNSELNRGLLYTIKQEFKAYQDEMAASATGAEKYVRNVRACQGKGVQQYKDTPK